MKRHKLKSKLNNLRNDYNKILNGEFFNSDIKYDILCNKSDYVKLFICDCLDCQLSGRPVIDLDLECGDVIIDLIDNINIKTERLLLH